MPRLVVVSNRVALPDRKAAAGGLEVVIKPALRRHGGLWFGWSGRVANNQPGPPKIVEQDHVSYITIDLERHDFEEFYNGFANRVLWPILHYRLDLAEFTRRDLSGYFRVNEIFAKQLEAFLRPDDIVWAHDYHLIALANVLRERGHRNKIGFFIHIPCPPPEILAALPNHERVIPLLCQYDLIGFQTDIDAANFSRYLVDELGLIQGNGNSFYFGDRHVRIGVFPVGVETEAFARLAQRAMQTEFVREVLGSLSGRDMIIGVDRLDYTKGLPLRMEAYESFLTNFSHWRNRVTYLQITPRSRAEIAEYAEIGRKVGEAAGRINGLFGEASWTPIRYVNKVYTRNALAGLYRAARAALVTPLRDGMNLVAKEYVAAQNPEDPGVLILSRFAGAAQELKQALLVNPYDPEAVGGAINRALSMPLDERRTRHAALYKRLSVNDTAIWGERFLEMIEEPAVPNVSAENLRTALI